MKIPVSHYKKSQKDFFWNGGSLNFKNSNIILKNLFKTIEVFNVDKVKFKALPDELLFKSVEISDGEKSYTLLFSKSNYKKLSDLVNLL